MGDPLYAIDILSSPEHCAMCNNLEGKIIRFPVLEGKLKNSLLYKVTLFELLAHVDAITE